MNIKELFRLFRPRTLAAAFAPLFLGASFAYYAYAPVQNLGLSLFYTFLILIVVLSAQIVANLWNEYCDFKSGLDLHQKAGNAGSITRGAVSPTRILSLVKIFSLLACIVGIFLSYSISWWYVPAGLACILVSFCYSGGPKPISSTPFGELSSGLAMGLAIILITAYAWTRDLSLVLLIPAIPSTLLVGAIMLTNNIRDIENDRNHGRKTLPIFLGRQKAINLLQLTFLFVFFWIAAWTYIGVLPLTALITVLALIPSFKAVSTLDRYADTIQLDKAMGFTAMATMLYHLLLGLSLILSK